MSLDASDFPQHLETDYFVELASRVEFRTYHGAPHFFYLLLSLPWHFMPYLFSSTLFFRLLIVSLHYYTNLFLVLEVLYLLFVTYYFWLVSSNTVVVNASVVCLRKDWGKTFSTTILISCTYYCIPSYFRLGEYYASRLPSQRLSYFRLDILTYFPNNKTGCQVGVSYELGDPCSDGKHGWTHNSAQIASPTFKVYNTLGVRNNNFRGPSISSVKAI